MELTRNEVKAIGDRVTEILKTKPNKTVPELYFLESLWDGLVFATHPSKTAIALLQGNHNLGYVAQKIYGQCYIYISYCLAERLGVGLADVKDDFDKLVDRVFNNICWNAYNTKLSMDAIDADPYVEEIVQKCVTEMKSGTRYDDTVYACYKNAMYTKDYSDLRRYQYEVENIIYSNLEAALAKAQPNLQKALWVEALNNCVAYTHPYAAVKSEKYSKEDIVAYLRSRVDSVVGNEDII